jgi:hypothetical protein
MNAAMKTSDPVLSNDPLRALNASIHYRPTGLIPNADPTEMICLLNVRSSSEKTDRH